jgi:DMATS type aromatic prenyltransferase
MLQFCSYNEAQQYQYLIFFYALVTPALGDFIDPKIGAEGNTLLSGAGKLELSLTFTADESSVRLAFEPTGFMAGTHQDPFNCHAIRKLLTTLQIAEGVQLNSDIFDTLTEALMISQQEQVVLRTSKQSEVDNLFYKTQNILALNLRGGSVFPDLYVYPQLKSIATNTPVQEMLLGTLHQLDTQGRFSRGLELVEKYLQSTAASTSPMFLSYDLLPQAQATGRLFLSETQMTWDQICNLWTLGGTVPSPDGLEALKALWEIISLTPGMRGPADFPLLFGMELLESPPFIQPQIGFPMTGKSEVETAEAAVQFFTWLGLTKHASAYMASLKAY